MRHSGKRSCAGRAFPPALPSPSTALFLLTWVQEERRSWAESDAAAQAALAELQQQAADSTAQLERLQQQHAEAVSEREAAAAERSALQGQVSALTQGQAAAQAAAQAAEASLLALRNAAEGRAAAADAAAEQLREHVRAAEQRVRELEVAAAEVATPARGRSAADGGAGGAACNPGSTAKAAGRGRGRLTPLVSCKSTARCPEEPAGVPLLVTAGKWALAAGVAVVMGVAVGTQAGRRRKVGDLGSGAGRHLGTGR